MITITRNNTSQDAQIRYIALGDGLQCGGRAVHRRLARRFQVRQGELDFPAGVASETFDVPIVDHGVDAVPKTIQVSLFGPSTARHGLPRQGHAHGARATIRPPVHDPLDPLGLPNDDGER